MPHGIRRIACAALIGIGVVATLASAPAQPAIDTTNYQRIVATDMRRTSAGVDALVRRLEANDVVGAQQAWIDSRRSWTRSAAALLGHFPNELAAMDSWPNASAGFHAVEAALFGSGDAQAALAAARQLQAEAHDLDAVVANTRLDPSRLLSGAAGLANEMAGRKSEGTESQASATTIYDLQHNFDGIRTLYAAVFKQPLALANPALAQTIEEQIKTLGRVLHHDNFPAVNREALRAESGKLAALFVQAAGPLGLAPPVAAT
jgi:iron uptake system EfeUOB component EfeO/EfeM